MDANYKTFHRFLLIIDEELWKDFLTIKPKNISINEYLNEIIKCYVRENKGKK